MSLQSSLRCRSNLLLLSLLPLLLIFGCSEVDETELVDVSPPPDFTGIYRVRGTTTEIKNGATREIEGLVVLKQDGTGYVTNFDLRTAMAVEGEKTKISVEVIGHGTAKIGADTILRGESQTQLVRAIVPGVDARFPFLPRVVGARIISTTAARLRPDGMLEVDIESRPDQGETYAATRTSIVGQLVSRATGVESLPDVSAGP
jgi:hypothetical protein